MPAAALSPAVRPRLVLAHLAGLALLVGAMTTVPAVVALGLGDTNSAGRYAVVTALLTVAGAAGLRLPRSGRLQINEGMVLAAGAFLLSALAMSWPMAASGLAWEDALFEAVSGVTTTGLTMLPDPGAAPPSLLFARAWAQWYGGLGVIGLSLAFVMRNGVAAAKGYAATQSDPRDLAGGMRAHARRVAKVYATLTAACLAMLVVQDVPPWEALLGALSAVSTGGYSPYSDGLAGAGGRAVQTTVLLFCVAGATASTLYYGTASSRRSLRLALAQLAALILLAAASASLVAWALVRSGNGDAADAVLLAFSAQTTAGYSPVPVADLGPMAKAALLPAMLIGGSVDSTAGGIKLLRLLALAALVTAVLRRARASRHAHVVARQAGSRLADGEAANVASVVALYLAGVFVAWIPFLAAGYPALDALFEVTSAFGTVGLSTGLSGPDLPLGLKAVLCAAMLAGRLEILCWLVVLHPATWFSPRVPT